MRRGIGRWAAAAAICIAAPAAASDSSSPPVLELVRSLSRIQDRIVAGDRNALTMQGHLLSLADKTIGAIPAADVHKEDNVKALISYGLSGGNPGTLNRQLQMLGEDDRMAVLGAGLVAYMRGQHEEAMQDLTAFDAMTLDPEIGAPLALLQGSLYVHEHPEEALTYFDKARLLAPGTIVEESALRRSLAEHVRLGHGKDFLDTARRYAQRFVRSPYGEQFAAYFSNGVVTLHGAFDYARIAEIADAMPVEYRRAIYVRIARQAALHGLAELASFAISHALPAQGQPAAGDEQSAADEARLAFYGILSAVTSDDPQKVRSELGSVKPSTLPPEDRDLLEAGRAMADALLKTAAIQADADGQASHTADAVDHGPDVLPAGETDHAADDQAAPSDHGAAEAAAGSHGTATEEPAGDDFSALDTRMADWKKSIEQADQALVESSQ